MRSKPEEALRIALAIFEGEGFVLLSRECGLVHLEPRWLADRVKPIADHRLTDKTFCHNLVERWEEKRDDLDAGEVYSMFDTLAHRRASVDLLKLLLFDGDCENADKVTSFTRLRSLLRAPLLLALDDGSFQPFR